MWLVKCRTLPVPYKIAGLKMTKIYSDVHMISKHENVAALAQLGQYFPFMHSRNPLKDNLVPVPLKRSLSNITLASVWDRRWISPTPLAKFRALSKTVSS